MAGHFPLVAIFRMFVLAPRQFGMPSHVAFLFMHSPNAHLNPSHPGLSAMEGARPEILFTAFRHAHP